LPIHLIIMGTMALTMLAFGYTYKIARGGEGVKLAMAGAVGVIVNAPVSLYFVSLMMGKGIFVLLPILSLGAFINVLVAIILFKAIKRSAKYEE
ncbi:MAG: ECF transporter S component, partial [Bacillota bacterium]|nr:ECF transporter S component [Bacillota bacterium]